MKNFSASASMSRGSNESSPDELRKVLKVHCPSLQPQLFFSLSTEQQNAEQEELLKEMILLSSRPTASWISAACKQVWQRCDSETVGKFAEAMATCSQHCFQKAMLSTTGVKLSPAAKRLVQVINRSSTRPLSLADKLVRRLKRVS